jgi:hypothetical protein
LLARQDDSSQDDPEPQIAARALLGLWHVQADSLRRHLAAGSPVAGQVRERPTSAARPGSSTPACTPTGRPRRQARHGNRPGRASLVRSDFKIFPPNGRPACPPAPSSFRRGPARVASESRSGR